MGVTSKGLKVMAAIKKHSRDFNGSLSHIELMRLEGFNRNTYYKYKKILAERTYGKDIENE